MKPKGPSGTACPFISGDRGVLPHRDERVALLQVDDSLVAVGVVLAVPLDLGKVVSLWVDAGEAQE